MQIHDRFNGPHFSQTPRTDEPRSTDKRRAAQDAPAVIRTSGEDSVLRQLQEMPELRLDVLARVRTKLEAGDYLSPQSARDAAQAMLNAG